MTLGAEAVWLGRATLYGLAAGGPAGAEHALSLLRGEIDRTLGLLGFTNIQDLTSACLIKQPSNLLTLLQERHRTTALAIKIKLFFQGKITILPYVIYSFSLPTY
nr:alpha-hydroxy-acid oxidizing protein [Halomonas nanhaiensis]